MVEYLIDQFLVCFFSRLDRLGESKVFFNRQLETLQSEGFDQII